MKLFTVGQIAKKYKVPLANVYKWTSEIQKKAEILDSGHGVIWMPNDPYNRMGMPEKIVELFPNIPDTLTVKRLIQEVDSTYQPDTKW